MHPGAQLRGGMLSAAVLGVGASAAVLAAALPAAVVGPLALAYEPLRVLGARRSHGSRLVNKKAGGPVLQKVMLKSLVFPPLGIRPVSLHLVASAALW